MNIQRVKEAITSTIVDKLDEEYVDVEAAGNYTAKVRVGGTTFTVAVTSDEEKTSPDPFKAETFPPMKRMELIMSILHPRSAIAAYTRKNLRLYVHGHMIFEITTTEDGGYTDVPANGTPPTEIESDTPYDVIQWFMGWHFVDMFGEGRDDNAALYFIRLLTNMPEDDLRAVLRQIVVDDDMPWDSGMFLGSWAEEK